MSDELAFKTRTVLNTLALLLALARARHLGRRLLAHVLTVAAIPPLVIVWAIESTIREVVNLVVLIAWLLVLKHQR